MTKVYRCICALNELNYGVLKTAVSSFYCESRIGGRDDNFDNSYTVVLMKNVSAATSLDGLIISDRDGLFIRLLFGFLRGALLD